MMETANAGEPISRRKNCDDSSSFCLGRAQRTAKRAAHPLGSSAAIDNSKVVRERAPKTLQAQAPVAAAGESPGHCAIRT